MQLISDQILIDSGQQTPTHRAIYPTFEGFDFWNPSAWTSGHPFDLYGKMRAEAPVMWSTAGKGISGFWSITRYDDIKAVELAHKLYSSQRGSINMAVPERKNWRPKKLVPAAFAS